MFYSNLVSVMENMIEFDYFSDKVSELLKKRINSLKIERIKEGFSGKSYRLITSLKGTVENYFLKEIENKPEYYFYKKIVCKIGVPTPYIYGVLSLDSRTYILMEYILSFKTRWNDKQRYLKAIDLLIEKDLSVQNNWKRIKQSKFVNKEVSYKRIIGDISRINE